MDCKLEAERNRIGQEQIADKLNNLETTRQLFFQESLRLEGELRIIKRIQEEEKANVTDTNADSS